MAIFMGRTPAQTRAGNILHDGIIFGTPRARIIYQLAAAGLIDVDKAGPVIHEGLASGAGSVRIIERLADADLINEDAAGTQTTAD